MVPLGSSAKAGDAVTANARTSATTKNFLNIIVLPFLSIFATAMNS
jgi:hypothetical protein